MVANVLTMDSPEGRCVFSITRYMDTQKKICK